MTAIPVYLGHPRDPHKEPRFGDVFRYDEGASIGPSTVLYIAPLDERLEDFWGLALDSPFGPDEAAVWVTLNSGSWSFIETIVAHATITADFSGMSYHGVLRALYGASGASVSPIKVGLGSGS